VPSTPRTYSKACIDQNDVDASLALLPVYLAGCQSLVVLLGPTYCTRLWCIVELFVFLRVGGASSDLDVEDFCDVSDMASSAIHNNTLKQRLAQFNASEACCYKASDKQHMLAVIETGFGRLSAFDSLVRQVLLEASSRRLVSERTPQNVDAPNTSITIQPQPGETTVTADQLVHRKHHRLSILRLFPMRGSRPLKEHCMWLSL